MMKNLVSHILFFLEKGAYRIPGSAENGGYSARTSVPPPCEMYIIGDRHNPKNLNFELSFEAENFLGSFRNIDRDSRLT